MIHERLSAVPHEEHAVARAMTEISALRQVMTTGGTIDVEGSLFDEILRDLESGLLSPEEAIAKAHALHSSRGSYH